jgi:hypothetical protein
MRDLSRFRALDALLDERECKPQEIGSQITTNLVCVTAGYEIAIVSCQRLSQCCTSSAYPYTVWGSVICEDGV